jgi:hypothetical protein
MHFGNPCLTGGGAPWPVAALVDFHKSALVSGVGALCRLLATMGGIDNDMATTLLTGVAARQCDKQCYLRHDVMLL